MTPFQPDLTCEKYELKFLIPEGLVAPILKNVEAHCESESVLNFAKHPKVSPDGFYQVSSLYLGSPKEFEKKETAENECFLLSKFQFFMRVRSFEAVPNAPFYFEMTYKVRNFIKQKRSQVNTDRWPDLLKCRNFAQSLQMTVSACRYLEDFIFMVMNYNLQPLFQTQFQRKRFHSKDESGVGVMFDKDFFYKKTSVWKLDADIDKKGAIGHYNNPQCVVLKFYWKSQRPSWMKELISCYDLKEVEFSNYKYAQDKLNSLNNSAVTII